MSKIECAFQNDKYTPVHWERAFYVDECEYATDLLSAYSSDKSTFDKWEETHGNEFGCCDHELSGPVGLFKECHFPRRVDIETTFSSPMKGVIAFLEGSKITRETNKHGYDGSLIDRIPLSQWEKLASEGSLEFIHTERGEIQSERLR